jgi:hypothetical protein
MRAFAIQENYRLCMQVYDQAHIPTFHNGHTHRNGTTLHEMRQDLTDNRCRQVLKHYWIEL